MKKVLSALLVAALVGLPTLFVPAKVLADDTTTGSGPHQERRRSAAGNYGYSRRYPAGRDRQSRLRNRLPLGAESGVHRRRQLRPRCNDLPPRPEFPRTLGRAEHDGFGRRQRRIPDRRPGHRLRSAGYEQQRRQLDLEQQSETRRRRFGLRAVPLAAPPPPKPTWPCALKFSSYSRSRGAFAGISLSGSTVRPDNDANERIYGKKIPAKSIVLGGAVAPTADARQLLSVLNKHSPKNLSK